MLIAGIVRLMWPQALISPGIGPTEKATFSEPTSSPIIVNLPPTGSGIETATLANQTQTPTLSVTLIGPRTPADEWANRMLDRLIPLFAAGLDPGDGFAWWQSQESGMPLAYESPDVRLGDQPLDWATLPHVEVVVPDPAHPNQLKDAGFIETGNGTVTLTLLGWEAGETDAHWILTDVSAEAPIAALAIQAAARSMVLRVATSDLTESQVTLVIVGIQPIAVSVPTSTPATIVSSPTLLPPPTATRIPDIVLGRLVSAKVDVVLDALPLVLPESSAAYASRHPLIGPLEWSENGARIGGRPVGISQATDLTIEYVAPRLTDGVTIRLLKADFGDDVTRITSDGMVFQGHRMEEILYWLVYRSTERQGVLVVAYDDFGARQSVGIVGFTPFSH